MEANKQKHPTDSVCKSVLTLMLRRNLGSSHAAKIKKEREGQVIYKWLLSFALSRNGNRTANSPSEVPALHLFHTHVGNPNRAEAGEHRRHLPLHGPAVCQTACSSSMSKSPCPDRSSAPRGACQGCAVQAQELRAPPPNPESRGLF